MSKGLGQKIGIRFTQPIVSGIDISKEAFAVTGKEYKYVNGPIIDRVYEIYTLEQSTSDSSVVYLNMETFNNRFNNSEGVLTISYNASIGVLMGRGGAVESFELAFNPMDLEPKSNPNQSERIRVGVASDVSLLEVKYNHAYTSERIAVSASVAVDLIHVDIVNP